MIDYSHLKHMFKGSFKVALNNEQPVLSARPQTSSCLEKNTCGSRFRRQAAVNDPFHEVTADVTDEFTDGLGVAGKQVAYVSLYSFIKTTGLVLIPVEGSKS